MTFKNNLKSRWYLNVNSFHMSLCFITVVWVYFKWMLMNAVNINCWEITWQMQPLNVFLMKDPLPRWVTESSLLLLCHMFTVSVLQEAYSVARQFNLIPPICEQAEYHLFQREKVEVQLPELFHKIGKYFLADTFSQQTLASNCAFPLPSFASILIWHTSSYSKWFEAPRSTTRATKECVFMASLNFNNFWIVCRVEMARVKASLMPLFWICLRLLDGYYP